MSPVKLTSSTMSINNDVTLCEVCAARGERTELQLFQINFNEALWMCPNQTCSYPIGAGEKYTKGFVVPRPSTAINQAAKRRRSRETSRSTSCSSSRSGSPVPSHGKAPWSPPLKCATSPTELSFEDIKLHSPPEHSVQSKLSHPSLLQSALSGTPSQTVPSAISPPIAVFHEQKTSLPLSQGVPNITGNIQSKDISKPLPKFNEELLKSGKPKSLGISNSQRVSLLNTAPVSDTHVGLQKLSKGENTVNFAGQKAATSPNPHPSIAPPLLVSSGDGGLCLPPDPSRVKEDAPVLPQIPHAQNKDHANIPGITYNTGNEKKPANLFSSHPNAISCPSFQDFEDGFDMTSIRPKVESASTVKKETVHTTTTSVVKDEALHSPEKELSPTNQSKQADISAEQRNRLKSVRLIQWQNRDALCWLDVAMCLLVQSRPFANFVKSTAASSCPVAKDLLDTYGEAQKLIRKVMELNKYVIYGQKQTILLQTSFGMITVKTGGGDKPEPSGRPFVINTNLSPMKTPSSNTDASRLVITTEELKERAMSKFQEAQNIMMQVRERVWRYLYPKLKCEKGTHDSPVFALHFLLGEDQLVKKHFVHNFQWLMICQECGYKHSDNVSKPVITLPEVPKDFTMRKPHFYRPCLRCHAPNQKMEMLFKDFPPVFFVHFVEGLHKKRLSSYDFFNNKQHYTITGVIQWKHNPDHFVAWLRNPTCKMWMKCDDLEKPLCHYEDQEPEFPASQAHIVMWTRKAIHATMPAERAEPLAMPLKSVLKPPRPAATATGPAKRKVSLEGPPPQRQKKQPASPRRARAKTVPAAPVASIATAAQAPTGPGLLSLTHALPQQVRPAKNMIVSRKDLIARLMNVPKVGNTPAPTSQQRLHNIKKARAEFQQRKKSDEMKPEELAKRILSRGLIPGVSKYNPPSVPSVSRYNPPLNNYVSAQDTIAAASTSSTGSFVRRAPSMPSFTGYVPRNQPLMMDLKSKGYVGKDVYKSTSAYKQEAPAPAPKQVKAAPQNKKGRKRKSDDSQQAPVKHVKISDTNVMISHDAPLTKPVTLFTAKTTGQPANVADSLSMHVSPPSVNDVLGELCEKLDIPNVGACNKETDGFSLDDLFENEGGKTGERIKPIESSLAADIDFDLDMFSQM